MMLILFIILTFAISLLGFAFISLIPAARLPETAIGLSFWLLMVWGPSLAAMILSFRGGQLLELLRRSIQISTVPISAWLLVLAPLALLCFLRDSSAENTVSISASTIAIIVAFNLILGPLGEEMGWRGFFFKSTYKGKPAGW